MAKITKAAGKPMHYHQSHAADWQRRQRYFIEKLRFEFAVRDIIERRTGKPASWDRTAVYLRDLAAELQTNQEHARSTGNPWDWA